MTPSVPRVILKAKRAQPFFGRHPWVFAGAIESVEGEPADGAEVDLITSAGTFVARGLFNSQSKIRVRLYSWDEGISLDRAFWQRRIAQAVKLRHHVLHVDRSARAAYRVAFGEADYLSGMVVDRYADFLTVQFTSLAMALRKDLFAELLAAELSPKGIYLRTEKGIGKLEGLTLQDGPLWGEPPPAEVLIEEHGLTFAVNLTEGQKTGYYLDQRDNRVAVARLCPGKRVLDAFCYAGGFGLYAAKAGAERVVCVDGSETAIGLAKANFLRNAHSAEFVVANVFHDLADRAAKSETFDVIVLDPPKFARDKRAVPEALAGYRRLHTLALKLLAPDGVLVSCCCSGLITGEELEDVISQCAVNAKRDLQILERRGPSPDHPVAITCRESGYLKCVISRVN
jgi:23S rRNA (cytosine1962-C5)-methyltransferase